jgi:nucleoid-associated protein YgaU
LPAIIASGASPGIHGEVTMGLFDNAGSIFGDKPEDTKKPGAKPDFSDTSSSSASSSNPRADFSDVTSGESTSAPPAGAGRTYTVKTGDSLSRIAKAHYGDAGQWKRIFEANMDKIKNPDLIHPGQEFTIPD